MAMIDLQHLKVPGFQNLNINIQRSVKDVKDFVTWCPTPRDFFLVFWISVYTILDLLDQSIQYKKSATIGEQADLFSVQPDSCSVKCIEMCLL